MDDERDRPSTGPLADVRKSRALIPGNSYPDPVAARSSAPRPDRSPQPEQRELDTARDSARADNGDVRRSGLRETLSLLVTKVTAAERAMRAAEETAEATNRAAAAAEERAEERVFAPFKAGFFAGAGLLLAYITYLSLDTIRSTLIVIAVAALLSIGLDPAVRFFERRGLRRGAAVAVVFVALLLVIAAAIFAIIPPIVQQLTTFIDNLPRTLQDLQNNPTIKGLDDKFGLIKKIQNSKFVGGIESGAASGIFTVAGVIFDLFVVLILTLYFLAGFPKIKSAGYRLAPASQRLRVTDLGDKILKQMGGYLSGATLIALQAGLVAGLFATIVGLPYPWAIALAASLFDFVPVVGPIIVGVSMTLLGFTESLTVGVVAGVFYLCQHLFEAYWLYPRVMRRTVHISSGAVIVAILVGGALLGVTGAILAVPVAAAVQLIVREVVMPVQERK
ncbi:MAG: AI-2E family transporter [Actinomycetota bacterium]|nr:AI-2E family transporter [Actinomycetota bacterium]